MRRPSSTTSSSAVVGVTPSSASTATTSSPAAGAATSFIGGLGDDVLIGGRAADTYYFATGDGHDKIRLVSNDTLDLSGTSATSFGSLDKVQTPQGVLIDLGGGDSVLFAKKVMSTLEADDFIF